MCQPLSQATLVKLVHAQKLCQPKSSLNVAHADRAGYLLSGNAEIDTLDDPILVLIE